MRERSAVLLADGGGRPFDERPKNREGRLSSRGIAGVSPIGRRLKIDKIVAALDTPISVPALPDSLPVFTADPTRPVDPALFDPFALQLSLASGFRILQDETVEEIVLTFSPDQARYMRERQSDSSDTREDLP